MQPSLAATRRAAARVRQNDYHSAVAQSRYRPEGASWGKCQRAASALRPIVSAKTLAETNVLAQRHKNIVFRAARS
jgi:hypothetical protein